MCLLGKTFIVFFRYFKIFVAGTFCFIKSDFAIAGGRWQLQPRHQGCEAGGCRKLPGRVHQQGRREEGLS